MESLYSATSNSKFSVLSRRKSNQKMRDRNPSIVPTMSEVKQRVVSARILRVKQLQNQIGELHHRLAVSLIICVDLFVDIMEEFINCTNRH